MNIFVGYAFNKSDIAVVGMLRGDPFTSVASSAQRAEAVSAARRAGVEVHGIVRRFLR